MAINSIAVAPATGTTVPVEFDVVTATGNYEQVVKLSYGALGSTLTVNTANPLPVQLTDGTNPVTVKAASTAALATDKAIVVALSPNNTVVGHGTAAAAMRVELPTDGTGVVGLNAGTNNIGSVGLTPAASGGCLTYHNAALTTTPAAAIKAAAGQLYALRIVNTSTTAALFVKLYNSASAPTIGAITIIETICVAAASSATQPTVVFWQQVQGVAFTTGIAFTITGALPDNDSTAIGASGTCSLDAEYK